MSLQNQHVFSIEHLENPETGLPFGSKYAGEFSIRRPTIRDKEEIALRDAANLARRGTVDLKQVNSDVVNMSYIFSYLSVVASKVPGWFDPAKLYDDSDEVAVYTVWSEVSRWLATFRQGANGATGGSGSGQAQVLVPSDIQPAAD